MILTMPDIDATQFPNIYRAIRSRRWYDAATQRVSSAAFVLRDQEIGLSVLKEVNCSPQPEACIAGLNTCFGELILATERVFEVGLQVAEDEPNDPEFAQNHAQIMGIPTERSTLEDVKIAEDFASLLAEMSNLHYDRHNRFLE